MATGLILQRMVYLNVFSTAHMDIILLQLKLPNASHA